MIQTTGTGVTDRGLVRERNEDAFLVRENCGLYIVSDGMSVRGGGKIASSTAIETVARRLEEEDSAMRRAAANQDRDALRTAIGKAINAACGDVFRLAQSNPELTGMRCTLTALKTFGTLAVIGHVGNSRVYLRRNGEVHQLSHDHTIAGELLRDGAITVEEADTHPNRNVLSRAVGPDKAVNADTLVVDLLPEDRLLLCSNGFSNYVPTSGWLLEQLDLRFDLEELAAQLVRHARAEGGSDNITVVLVDAMAEPEIDSNEFVDTMRLGLDALGQSFLFEELPLRALSALLGAGELKSVKAGEAVLEEGALTRALYVVVDGVLTVERPGLEPAHLIGGDSFGETSLFRPRQALATVRATKEATLLIFPRARFLGLVKTRPWLGVRILERIAHRLALDLDRERQVKANTNDPDPLALI